MDLNANITYPIGRNVKGRETPLLHQECRFRSTAREKKAFSSHMRSTELIWRAHPSYARALVGPRGAVTSVPPEDFYWKDAHPRAELVTV